MCKKPKRVLIVIGSLDLGGAERQAVNLAIGLKQNGYEPFFYLLCNRGVLKSDVLNSGIKIYSAFGDNKKQAFGKLLRGLVAFFKISLIFIKHNPTITCFILPEAYLIGGISALLFNRSGVNVMLRRSLNNYQSKRKAFAFAEHKLHGLMDAITGNCNQIIEQLVIEGANRCKLYKIYNGIDVERFERKNKKRLRSEFGIDDDEIVIIIVANLIPYKGHADLLNALGIVKDELPIKWRLLCLGRDDGIGSSLKQLSIDYQIEKNVSWLGQTLCVEDYLVSADIAVLPSHEEGFSNSILEAMSSGLPLVVTNVGGNSELIINNFNGFVVEKSCANDLGKSILSLVNNSSQRELFGKRSLEIVKKHYSISTMVNKYTALFDKLDAKKN